MSTASLPRSSGEAAPEPAAGAEPSEDEGWALLESMRRRLEEQAAQERRTQQQVAQLAESIAALVEAQRRRVRWLNLNSFVAYLIFTTLCGAGFYVLYQSRADGLARERDTAQRERELAVRRADEATTAAAARAQADGRAWEVYQLLEAGKRAEATDKLAALRDLPLSRTERAILAARAHETQVMAVDAALKAAGAAFRAGRHADVIAPLEAALLSEPAGARGVLMRYYLGVAYAKAGRLEPAISHLQAAVEGDTDQEDALFQLASALDRSGAWGRARVEYDRFATAHPQSPLAVFALRRSATLARMPPTAPPEPGSGGPAGAGSAAPPGGVVPPPGGVMPPPGGNVPLPGGVAPPPGGVAPPPGGVALPPGGVAPPPGGVAPPPGGGIQQPGGAGKLPVLPLAPPGRPPAPPPSPGGQAPPPLPGAGSAALPPGVPANPVAPPAGQSSPAPPLAPPAPSPEVKAPSPATPAP